MSRPFSPIVVIPARLGSTRLPGKPLSLIHGEPMIVHVWRRAAAADIGPVVVACAQSSIAEAVAGAGGRAVLTRPEHASGSDRVFEAVESLDPEGRHDVVVNLQGDLPTIAPEVVRAVLRPLGQSEAVDIATLAAQIVDPAARGDPNVVKAAVAFPPSTSSGQAQDRPLMLSLSKHEPVDPSTSSGLALPHPEPVEGRPRVARALYFSRARVPWDGGDETRPLYHHIGLYAFRRPALRRFAALPATALEAREGLEQLRALEAGLRIDVALVDTVPLGVDTPADLARARALMAPRSD